MNIRLQGGSNVFGSPVSMLQGGGLKSTQQKLQRQQKCQNEVNYWEGQKESLKTMKCGTVEEIEKKLDMLYSYEDAIAAAKQSYNNEQMWHVLDEAKEKAEKIAEETEKLKPKTAEERREDMIEEAQGTDEEKGAVTEALEEATKSIDEMHAEVEQEIKEKLGMAALEDTEEELAKQAAESVEMETEKEVVSEIQKEVMPKEPRKRLDVRI